MTKTVVDGVEGLQGLFDEIVEQIRQMDYEPVMVAGTEIIADLEKQFFDAGVDPNGNRWAPNAESTIKKKGHGIVLFETGALEKSLVDTSDEHNIHETSHRGLLFGTDIEYSLFNQEGTERIPARPHVGVTEDFCNVFADEIGDFIVEQLRGPSDGH